MGFSKNIKEGHITQEKADEEEKNNLKINKIVKGSKKTEERTNTIKNVKILHEPREKVMKFFDDYSRIISKAG